MKKDKIVIVDGVRTPFGKYGGSLKNLNSGFLASHVINELLNRTKVEAKLINEVILGEARQTTESSNVARVASLRSGIPVEASAFTINRLCASGMQAVTSGIQQIKSQQAEIVVAGGTESLSRAAVYLRGSRFGGDKAHLVDSNLESAQQPIEIYSNQLSMGKTAENVAEKYKISREDQDRYALESQKKVSKSIEEGVFLNEIVPINIQKEKKDVVFSIDEHPRSDSTYKKLSQLKPIFKEDGTVTAGNACGRNDGAAALLLMKESKAKELSLSSRATIIDWTTVGVNPKIMGIGPIPAINNLLKRNKMSINEIDLFEINEAFASQTLAIQRELKIPLEKLNINGGAIAIGHPLGATGTRIIITLINQLIKTGKQYGIASLCVGGGQGMAVLIENNQI